MDVIRKYRSLVLLFTLVVVCSVLVVRQFSLNATRHVELREAFILLCSKGYQTESQQLYHRLLNEVEGLSHELLWEDYQRTLVLVDPMSDKSSNLIWQYHWTISNELEKRSESSLEKALKMAREK